MTSTKDTYHDHGVELHHEGDSHPYLDPDFVANETDDQIPLLSGIGRGPKGDGVSVEVVSSTDSCVKFNLISDATGEVEYESPNLSAGVITVEMQNRDNPVVPGEVAHAEVKITRCGKTKTHVIDLPPGIDGSKIFSAPGIKNKTSNLVYQFNVSDIEYSGPNVNDPKYAPVVNDTITFIVRDNNGQLYLAIGQVSFADAKSVVVISRTYLHATIPTIGANGNWFIGATDTEVPATVSVAVGDTEVVAPGPAEVIATKLDDYSVELNFKIPCGVTFTPHLNVPNYGDLSFTNDGGMDNPDPVRIRATEYTPHMDVNTGELSWTNDGGKPNPATKNLTGPTIKIMAGEYREPGSTKELPDLPAFAGTDEGTAYVVDDDAIDGQYDLYIHGSGGTDWTVINNWAGVPGPAGVDGADGADGVDGVDGVVVSVNGSEEPNREIFVSESKTIYSPVSAESLEGTSIQPLGQSTTAKISSAGAIANGSSGKIHGAIGAIGTCPSTPVPYDGKWDKNVWLTSIQDQVNDYIHGSRNENDLDLPMGSSGFPLAAEAAYGLIGTCLGAGREFPPGIPIDTRTVNTSGTYYVPDPAIMLDNPRPEAPISGKLISDKDDYGIHHTYIAVDGVVYMRHQGTEITDFDPDTMAHSPWMELGRKEKINYPIDISDCIVSVNTYLTNVSKVNYRLLYYPYGIIHMSISLSLSNSTASIAAGNDILRINFNNNVSDSGFKLSNASFDPSEVNLGIMYTGTNRFWVTPILDFRSSLQSNGSFFMPASGAAREFSLLTTASFSVIPDNIQ